MQRHEMKQSTVCTSPLCLLDSLAHPDALHVALSPHNAPVVKHFHPLCLHLGFSSRIIRSTLLTYVSLSPLLSLSAILYHLLSPALVLRSSSSSPESNPAQLDTQRARSLRRPEYYRLYAQLQSLNWFWYDNNSHRLTRSYPSTPHLAPASSLSHLHLASNPRDTHCRWWTGEIDFHCRDVY